MPLFNVKSYYSSVLKRNLSANVFLPSKVISNSKLTVITLLHGICGDCNDWIYNTNALMAAEKGGFAVIMPQGDNGFYLNSELGRYCDNIIELIDKCAGWFGFSQDSENNAIAGLSMGGYGALSIGMKYWSRYDTIGSFSGIVDVKKHHERFKVTPENEWAVKNAQKVFPEEYYGTDFDLEHLLEKIPQAKQQNIYMYCGSKDRMYNDNIELFEKIKERYPTSLFEESDAAHSWSAWNYAFERFTIYLTSLKEQSEKAIEE